MAATHTPTSNPAIITVSGTSNNTIDLSKIASGKSECLIEWLTGTSIKFNTLGAAVAGSGGISSTVTRLILPIQEDDYLNCLGSAGSETFQITAL